MSTASLNRIVLKGFRSIREMDIELKPINLLIGANGAGKSNFLSFFRFVREATQRNLQHFVRLQGGADKVLHFGRKRTKTVEFSFAFADCTYGATLEGTRDNQIVFAGERWSSTEQDGPTISTFGGAESALGHSSGNPLSAQVVDRMNGWRVYHFHDTTDAAPVKGTTGVDQAGTLYSDASNLAAFLRGIRPSPAYDRILRTVQRVAPFIKDFVLEPEDEANRFVRFRWSHTSAERIFDVSDLSDGTLRFICLTTLLLQPSLPAIIIIDEPELGLHPAALNILAGMIQSVSARTQIIASTQSVTLTNQFGVDDIVVVDRKDEASVFRRLHIAELEGWLGEYSIGDLWEKNVIGGNP
jgi:predicted ATPase